MKLVLFGIVASLPVRERGLKSERKNMKPQKGQSLPVRERGLKFYFQHVGALVSPVAPRAGAWIEIDGTIAKTAGIASLPVRERGLKLRDARFRRAEWWSLPVRERGLKCPKIEILYDYNGRSPCGSVD